MVQLSFVLGVERVERGNIIINFFFFSFFFFFFIEILATFIYNIVAQSPRPFFSRKKDPNLTELIQRLRRGNKTGNIKIQFFQVFLCFFFF